MALIWVKATQLGFDGMQRRKVDSKFQIEASQFSAKWMKRIKPPQEHDEDELDVEEPPSDKPAGRGKPGPKRSTARASDESKI